MSDLPETQAKRRGHPFYPAREENLPAIYSTEDVEAANKMIVAHYFVGGCDWWIAEYDYDDSQAFGYACLGDPQNAEWGYTSLCELEPISLQGGLAVVERDLHWTPRPFSEVQTEWRRS